VDTGNEATTTVG
jgi:hypothetical protein